MKEVKKADINEIIRLAFAKYILSNSKKSMNTFIFRQYEKNHLSDAELELICDTLEKKIKEYEKKKRQKADAELKKEIRRNLKVLNY